MLPSIFLSSAESKDTETPVYKIEFSVFVQMSLVI